MKVWFIASNLVALPLGAWLTACSGAEVDTTSESGALDDATEELANSNFDVVDQEVTACDDHQYDHWRYLSALAVATANELGRWHPVDFVRSGATGMVQLSSTGLARCSEGCPNIQALLQMQDPATSFVPRHDPNLLKNLLVSYLDRQQNYNISHPVPNHTLTLTRTTNDVCGLRYHFKVGGGSTTTGVYAGSTELKPSHSGKCMDIAAGSMADGGRLIQYDCWGGDNQEFSVDSMGNGQYRLRNVQSGKCLGAVNAATHNGAALEQRTCGANDSQTFNLNSKGAGKFEVKNVKSGRCVDVANGSTANVATMQLYDCWGAPGQTFFAPSMTSSTSTPGTAPANLYNQLKLFGQGENGYLMFASTSTEVSIDPMGTLVEGGSSATSGSCYEGSTVYSGRNIAGSCCVVSGRFSTLQRSPLNSKVYFCR